MMVIQLGGGGGGSGEGQGKVCRIIIKVQIIPDTLS